MLGFMAVSGLLGQRNLRHLGVAVAVPDEVYAGQDTLIRVNLTNRRRLLPAFLIQVTLGEARGLFVLVRPGEEQSLTMTFSPPHRGRWSLPEIRLSSIFPVNFFRRGHSEKNAEDVLVFPTPVACSSKLPQIDASAMPAESSSAPGPEGDLTNILPYQREPLKMVHWRLSARQDDLIVKRLGTPNGEPLWLKIQDLPGRNLEDQLRCASFLINRLLRQQQPVGLRLASTAIAPQLGHTHRLRLLKEIALYGQD